jgi:hypothetical protein
LEILSGPDYSIRLIRYKKKGKKGS